MCIIAELFFCKAKCRVAYSKKFMLIEYLPTKITAHVSFQFQNNDRLSGIIFYVRYIPASLPYTNDPILHPHFKTIKIV
jgi:hypothetical protein